MAQRFCQSLCKISLVQMGVGHFFGCQFNHSGGKILPKDRATVFIKFRCQYAGSKPYIQHNCIFLLRDNTENAAEYFLVTCKWIRVIVIGNTYSFIISIGPHVKALVV